ncbi:hypothetical protein [Amycolatopsis albispora]|uniref:Uncharacterized protein n=1 Tax=Amycolatopsis albispora TaxID=1804986 RepID=A0A344L5G0_9PSEU|nr:hypothetical protein [Amycolatopsis albispora]AXB43284.1 hypothetical protein A4R43_12570 [Amycolatopsis albispora]
MIQGIGGLIQGAVHPDYHGWYLMHYIFDATGARIAANIGMILVGSFLLHITRDTKKKKEVEQQ